MASIDSLNGPPDERSAEIRLKKVRPVHVPLRHGGVRRYAAAKQLGAGGEHAPVSAMASPRYQNGLLKALMLSRAF